jgi:hypothetical protein
VLNASTALNVIDVGARRSVEFLRRGYQRVMHGPPPPPLRRRSEARVRSSVEGARWLERRAVRLEWFGPSLRLVTLDDSPRPWELATSNVAVVTTALQRAGVAFFETAERGTLASSLAVPATGWRDFLHELHELAHSDGAPLYVECIREGRRTIALLGEIDLAEVCTEADALVLFRYVKSGPKGVISGQESGCTVQRWAMEEDGTFAAPGRNPLASRISGDLIRTEPVQEWGRVRHRLSATLPSVLAVDEPVDVVYMWVDGDDPAWQQRMLATKAALTGEVMPEAAASSRFRDREELKHSLRSLERYAPWVRNIYLVTDQQVPAWLDPENPRITVVDHREIFSADASLPCFNSHAIASRLHHIDGLAEQYLILNDDVFVNRPVAPEAFFTASGMAQIFLSRARPPIIERERMSAIESARRNSAALIERDFGRTPSALFLHTPVPQLRSVMEELEEKYPEVFASLQQSQFRSRDDYEVNGWLHHYYALMTRRAVVGSTRYDYFDVGSDTGWARLMRLSPRSSTMTFCVNDSDVDEASDRSVEFTEWLRGYFSEPSSFERSGS